MLICYDIGVELGVEGLCAVGLVLTTVETFS